ncbi:DUF4238 domain-containing protein [Streptomyces sp. NPDC056132]|uniref:DUF4238 domain-containing protein n=1 Tax=Streptomyces sp. NPDC056132 TaxID=3345722 RepID=UPI0035DAE818
MAELAPQAGQLTSRQHLVSQVLLAEFTAPVRKVPGYRVIQFDLVHPDRVRSKFPREAGFVPDFVPYASSSLETFWNRFETPLPKVFSGLKEQVPLDDPQLASPLLDLLALHFARSHHTRNLHRKVFADFYPQATNWLLTERRGLLQLAAWERTGLVLAGEEGLAFQADRLLARMVGHFESGALLRDRIEVTFTKAREIFGRCAPQVLQAAEGEFLIGDNPASSIRIDGTTHTFGVALGDAHTVVMPLGPKHAVCLSDEPKYATVSKAMVDWLNTLQVVAAERYVYARPPISSMEAFVRRARAQRREALATAALPCSQRRDGTDPF